MSASSIQKSLWLLILSLGIAVGTAAASEHIWAEGNKVSYVFEIEKSDDLDPGDAGYFLPSDISSFTAQTSPKIRFWGTKPNISPSFKSHLPIRDTN